MSSQVSSIISTHNLRLTKSRQGILSILSKAESPVSVDILVSELNMNKTTVYREIETLTEKGIIVDVEFGDGKKRYELISEHHHHLICITCKRVSDIHLSEDLIHEEKTILQENKFKVLRHSLEFFGLCNKCQSNQ
jgi:Fe2+ or Zn2+ uptake regulation protein